MNIYYIYTKYSYFLPCSFSINDLSKFLPNELNMKKLNPADMNKLRKFYFVLLDLQ